MGLWDKVFKVWIVLFFMPMDCYHYIQRSLPDQRVYRVVALSPITFSSGPKRNNQRKFVDESDSDKSDLEKKSKTKK